MNTERPSPRYSGIDQWSPGDALDALIESQFAAVSAVHAARGELLDAALAVAERLENAVGRLVYAGAGTSGRLAVQDGAELIPTFSWPQERLLLWLAGGDAALTRAVEGAEDDADAAHALVRDHAIGRDDVLIGLAASGSTPFTLACLREAGQHGALTIAIANNRDAPLLQTADHAIWLDTGAEPIAGSTRMKAGTAQRAALTVLSSLVMIRLGRVYRGLMVDLQAVNTKLVKRSENILVHLTGHGRAEVREALRRAGGNVKAALLVLEGIDLNEALDMLDQAGGRLGEAKDLARNHPRTRRPHREPA